MFKVQNDHIFLLNLIMNIKLISNCRVKCSYLSNKLLNFPLKVANTSSVDHCLVRLLEDLNTFQTFYNSDLRH